MPRTRIRSTIPLNRGLPSVMLLRTREERKLRRIPVARHESLEIMPVPSFLLRVQHVLNNSLRTVLVGAAHRSLAADQRATKEKEEEKEEAGKNKPAAHANLRILLKAGAHQFRTSLRRGEIMRGISKRFLRTYARPFLAATALPAVSHGRFGRSTGALSSSLRRS